MRVNRYILFLRYAQYTYFVKPVKRYFWVRVERTYLKADLLCVSSLVKSQQSMLLGLSRLNLYNIHYVHRAILENQILLLVQVHVLA